jgi:hypothetical protein
MQLWQYCLLVTARLLYMFRTLSASIIRSTKNCISSRCYVSWVQGRLPLHYSAVATHLGHPHRIYIIPTHDTHQWLLIQFLVFLMMNAESV